MEELYALGNNGISVPTDNILERALPEVLSDTVVFINIATLVRNAIGSFVNRRDPAVINTIHDRVAEDLENLKAILSGMGTRLITYYVPYAKLPRKGLVNYSQPKTDKQIAAAKTFDASVELCKDMADYVMGSGFHNPEPHTIKRASIITHYTHDLITSGKLTLLLIESYTGAVKRPIDWNTKLAVKPEYLEYIPFNPITYYVFGDKGNDYVAPMAIATRRKLYDIAVKYNWTPATTINRVMFCLQQEDNIMYDYLKQFNKI